MLLVERSDQQSKINHNAGQSNDANTQTEYLRIQLSLQRVARQEAEAEAKKWQKRCINAKLNNLNSQFNKAQQIYKLSKSVQPTIVRDGRNQLSHNNVGTYSVTSKNISSTSSKCQQILYSLEQELNKLLRQHDLCNSTSFDAQQSLSRWKVFVNNDIANLHNCIIQLEGNLQTQTRKIQKQLKLEKQNFRPQCDVTVQNVNDGFTNSQNSKQANSQTELITYKIVKHLREEKKLIFTSGVFIAAAHIVCFSIAGIIGKFIQYRLNVNNKIK